jgi:hypothetical protein
MTNRIDHTGHDHPSTTAARQACKRAMESTVVTPTANIAADLRKLNTAMKARDERNAANADAKGRAKAQAKRRPAGRVSADDPRTCVQWELHHGTGRCACGWAA